MSESLNNTKKEYASVEDLLDMHRITSNETALISQIPNIINEENVIIAPEQEKKTVSFLSYKFYEKQAFPYLLPKSKFGYNASLDIPINPARYFNQRLLNFNQQFASDTVYLFLLRFVYG